jgi:hypothetical protein
LTIIYTLKVRTKRLIARTLTATLTWLHGLVGLFKKALKPTMTTTFHVKQVDTTNSRSGRQAGEHGLLVIVSVEQGHAPKYSGKKAILIT